MESSKINLIAISFIFFLVLMIAVGVISSKEAEANSEDYLLAGRKVNPWVMALSMLSTNYSGFMFIGYIGYTYTNGVSSIWYLVTWALGDLIAWFTIHKRLRIKSKERNLNTITSFVASCEKKSRIAVIKVASIISFVFLSIYAAAQLKVSSKALYSMLGWDYNWGIVVAGVIVALYCFSGGIRASIWTDVIQSVLMCVAMLILLVVTILHCGGFEQIY